MTFQSALLAGLLAVTDGTWEVVPDDGAEVVSLDPLAREHAAGTSLDQSDTLTDRQGAMSRPTNPDDIERAA